LKINLFDTEKGSYSFEESNLVTVLHSHPILELVKAKNGSFSLQTDQATHDQLKAAIILPNQPHALLADHCTVDIIIMEPLTFTIEEMLNFLDLEKTKAYYTYQESHPFIEQIIAKITTQTVPQSTQLDERIAKCIQFIHHHIQQKKLSLSLLADHVHLSTSRLSHLFKAIMGVPIQKYITWVRIKSAINIALANGIDLQDAALSSGFYDAAHFSRKFKEMMGVKPSSAYNSRIVQDF